jgi:hypothetical protein
VLSFNWGYYYFDVKPMNETPFHVLLIICSMMGFLSILELVCGLFGNG